MSIRTVLPALTFLPLYLCVYCITFLLCLCVPILCLPFLFFIIKVVHSHQLSYFSHAPSLFYLSVNMHWIHDACVFFLLFVIPSSFCHEALSSGKLSLSAKFSVLFYFFYHTNQVSLLATDHERLCSILNSQKQLNSYSGSVKHLCRCHKIWAWNLKFWEVVG